MSTENEQHDQVEHVDEKWLVSYADMMTLLFGLFVMLYSMAMEHQGDINSQLQKISEEKFTDQEKPAPVVQEDAAKLREEIEKLKIDLQTTQTTLTETDLKKRQAETRIEELLKQLELMEPLRREQLKMNQKLQSLENTKNNIRDIANEKDQAARKALVMETKALELEAKTVQLESKSQIFESRALASETKVQTLETKLRDLETQLQQSRAVAAIPVPKPEQISNRLKDQLQKLEAQMQDAQRQLQQKDQQLLQAQQSQQALQNQKPPEPKAPEPPRPQPRNFGLVLMKWTTKLHDLDMVIKDPNGRKFDFKHRTHGSNPGEFVLDSRTGPGAEIWQSNKLIPGNYELQINLYQSYGNSAPAEASVSFQTPYSNAEIGRIILTEKSPSKTLRFTVDKDGRATQN